MKKMLPLFLGLLLGTAGGTGFYVVRGGEPVAEDALAGEGHEEPADSTQTAGTDQAHPGDSTEDGGDAHSETPEPEHAEDPLSDALLADRTVDEESTAGDSIEAGVGHAEDESSAPEETADSAADPDADPNADPDADPTSDAVGEADAVGGPTEAGEPTPAGARTPGPLRARPTT